MTGERKIRVVHIIQALEQGGMEDVVASYAARHDRRQFDVSVVSFVGGRAAARIASMPSVRLEVISARRLQRLGRLARWLRSQKPDVVHNHFNWYGLAAAWTAGVPVRVETVHNVYTWLGTGERALYSASVLPASALIAVSKQVAEYTRARFWGARRKPFCVIGNGVDTARFAPGPCDEGLRKELGLGQGGIVAGFLGRLVPEKNLAGLLDAAEMVAETGPPITVLLAGAGSAEPQLRQRAASMRHARALFVGHVERPEKFLRMLDMVVFPSDYEGVPLALLQGMATGKPAVVTRVGGMPDTVTDGVQGLVVPARDTAALAEAIRILASDDRQRRAMGERAREHVLAEHSEDAMVRRTEKLYFELLVLARR